jgi:hypothetical protein
LAYDRGERNLSIDQVKGMLMVPLAYLDKVPLRHFDARTGNDSVMPILGMSETTPFVVAMVQRMLQVDGVKITSDSPDILAQIAGPTVDASDGIRVERFLESGEWGDKRAWGGPQGPKPLTQSVIRTVSQRFLLTGLIGAAAAGTRQVLKFGYHWSVESSALSNRTAPLVAGGWGPRQLTITPLMADAARSYHLEFQTPPELRCIELRLPEPVGAGERNLSWVDRSAEPVAHAHASYSSVPEGSATVSLSVPLGGMRRAALTVNTFSALLVGLMLFLPWAKNVWINSPESSAAVLIAVPAVFFGLLAAGREHTLVADALAFLRFMILSAALSLFLVAASIVGDLNQPFLEILWGFVACWNLVAAGFLFLSGLVSKGAARLVGSVRNNCRKREERKGRKRSS